MKIDIIDETKTLTKECCGELQSLVINIISGEIDNTAELSILFCGEAEILRLNREYREIDGITDVLSFPNFELDKPAKFGNPFEDEQGVYLGDIAICVPFAHKQAERIGQSLEAELKFLTAHGVLHLLGYDHETEEDEMFEVQRKYLNRIEKKL